jgi:hypothetical protein
MSTKRTPLTRQGAERLRAELERLKSGERPRIIAAIAEARAHGDLKENAGLSHLPSGRFGANGAWAVLSSIAHNLVRWLAALGMRTAGPVVAKTVRRRLLALPGRLTRSARRRLLHLPTSWPWAEQWLAAYERLCVLRT